MAALTDESPTDDRLVATPSAPAAATVAVGPPDARPAWASALVPRSGAVAASSFKNYVVEHGHVVHRFAEVCAPRGILVRAGVEAASAKVARLPHGAPVRVVREAVSVASGLVRLRVQTRGAFAGGSVDGWVSETSARGTRLLEITDAHPPPEGEPGREASDGAARPRRFPLSPIARGIA